MGLVVNVALWRTPLHCGKEKPAPFRKSAEAFSSLKIVLGEVCGVEDMKLLRFKVRLSVNVLNLRRPLSIVIHSTSLFGVGGSGRSPVSPPTPWVRRGGRLVEGIR